MNDARTVLEAERLGLLTVEEARKALALLIPAVDEAINPPEVLEQRLSAQTILRYAAGA